MKSVLIVHNQVLGTELLRMLDELKIRGFTQWNTVQGRGGNDGDPRMGTHTWPELNGALLCVVEDDVSQQLLARIREMDEAAPEQGLRAFAWTIDETS